MKPQSDTQSITGPLWVGAIALVVLAAYFVGSRLYDEYRIHQAAVKIQEATQKASDDNEALKQKTARLTRDSDTESTASKSTVKPAETEEDREERRRYEADELNPFAKSEYERKHGIKPAH